MIKMKNNKIHKKGVKVAKRPAKKADVKRHKALPRHTSIKNVKKHTAVIHHATVSSIKKKEIEAKAAAGVARANAIKEAIENAKFSSYIAKNVGKKGNDIIKLLTDYQTDESIAEKTGVKINEVRRILNSLNTIGVARYESDKASNGWLTFRWYIDSEKLRGFVYKINEESNGYSLPENCNDFFICENCFDENKTVFPFWTAEEMNFKCECGHMMKRVSKEEVQELIKNNEEHL